MQHAGDQLDKIVSSEKLLQGTVGQKKVEQGLATEIFKLDDMDESVGERPMVGDNVGMGTQQVEHPEFGLEGFEFFGEFQGNLGWKIIPSFLFGVDHDSILSTAELFENPIGPSLEVVDVFDCQDEWHLRKR